MFKKILVVGLIGTLALSLTAASCNDNPSAVKQEQRATNTQIDRYLKSQPIPAFDWSQVRQNLIEIQTAQVDTTQTSAFFFRRGGSNGDPVMSCPSIGYPIPSTYQLTNPHQVAKGYAVIGQAEATGVYTGDSSATYVMCVNAQGKLYAVYWEGDVMTVSGRSEWNAAKGQIELVGLPSFEFTKKK